MLDRIKSPNKNPNTQRPSINTTKSLKEWEELLGKNFKHMSKPEIQVLALWTYGMILAKTCGLSRVAATLACNLQQKEGSVRQRLREWYRNKEDKKGMKRREWQVQKCFIPLLEWIIAQWPKDEQRLVLAMDATSLKQVFVVLSISVVYRSCAIPVAWAILPEGKKGSWKKPWLDLFQCLQNGIPENWEVLVMADRGLYAHWLYDAICQNHWPPFLRINMGGMYLPKGATKFRKMSQLLPKPGKVWAGRVTCFRNNSVEGTLLACWGTNQVEPWLILTDLSPEYSSASWYGMRCWIEGGFKDLKRDGWQWQKARMLDPARAERIWLVLAVATFWVVSVGGEADVSLPTGTLENLPPSHIAIRNSKSLLSKKRHLSCFNRGLIEVLNMFIHQHPIFIGHFYPESWPLKTYP